LARYYGVDPKVIRNILKWKTWNHLQKF